MEKVAQRLLSQQEAATYLGVKKDTLRYKLREKQWTIPKIIMGRRVFFDVKDLDAFVDTQNKVVNT